MKGGKFMEFQEFLDSMEVKSVSIKEASQLMGKSEQFIRVGLRNKRLPFGVAVQLSTQWTYYISPKLFYEYIGYTPTQRPA